MIAGRCVQWQAAAKRQPTLRSRVCPGVDDRPISASPTATSITRPVRCTHHRWKVPVVAQEDDADIRFCRQRLFHTDRREISATALGAGARQA